MPLHLHTGLNGSAKTLYTLSHVKELADKTGRPVYQVGIRGCKLPWLTFNPEEWFKLPSGALIIFDEAQDYFRPRPNGAPVPEYVARLEKQRHDGYDIFLTCPHPMDLDVVVRRTVGVHKHLMRWFGQDISTIHEFQGCRENADKSRNGSEETPWPHDKKAYAYYESATLHTIKKRIPRKLLIFPIAIAALASSVFVVAHWFHKSAPGATLQGSAAAAGSAEPSHAVAYTLDSFKPRIHDLPESAPRYDGITRPVRAPKITGSMVFRGQCHLIQADGTVYPSTQQFCMDVVKNGLPHYDWDNPEDKHHEDQRRDPDQQNQTPSQPVVEIAQSPIKTMSMPDHEGALETADRAILAGHG